MAAPIRIRMYRPGFGDCFLISYGASASARHVLVDFGAHMHGEIGTMEGIMDNIELATNKKLELIVASHAHRDHISGFGKFADRFADFEIGEVWLPWTDDPDDKDAAALEKKQLALYDILNKHLRLALGATEADPRFASALHALSNLAGNDKAKSELARGFGTGAKVRYLKAGVSIAKVAAVTGLSADILSPPKEKEFFSRMDPPSSQRFLAAPGDTSGAIRPFPYLEIRKGERDYQAIKRDKQPLLAATEIAELHTLAEAPAGRLALALDNVRNNTSLVIVFRYRGKSLLFPGDAQWGNWQSWIDSDDARRLVGELDFFKVAHHGSDNATPVDVVKALRKSGLAAMVSTQKLPYPTIPRLPLIAELQKHCAGEVVVRSDTIKVTGAPKFASQTLPKGFTTGELWIDYNFK
jgi:hypothetical protein